MSKKPITQLLTEFQKDKRENMGEFLTIVYGELRRLAAGYLKRERNDHTLQPTALVHEAYLRLVGQAEIDWQSRAQFFGVAAHVMREILIDHARARNAQKRGGEFKTRILIDDVVIDSGNEKILDIITVNEALGKLEEVNARQAQIVEMKFFCSLKVEEIAEVLDISPATVKREWSSARLLLYKFLNGKTKSSADKPRMDTDIF